MYIPTNIYMTVCKWYGKPFPWTIPTLTRIHFQAQIEVDFCEEELDSITDAEVNIAHVNNVLARLQTAKHIQHIVQPYI
jgi:hypothetical protein